MPTVVQWITYAIPMRYFLVIVRGIFLKGSGLNVLWDQVLPLLIFGVVFFGVGVMRFRKKVS
jgi:ABC-2 type transport system permease protein